MRKLIATLLLSCIFLVPTKLSAEGVTVYNDLGVEFSAGDEICANRNYFIENDGDYKEIAVLDSETKQILDIFNSNSTELEVAFPENSGDLTLLITPYTEEKQLDNDNRTSIDVSIIPCDYEEIATDYEFKDIPFTYTFSGNNLTITKDNNFDNFKVGYQFLDSLVTEEYDFADSDTLTIDMADHDLIQIVTNYTNTSGAEVSNYYELEYNKNDSNYFIREVNQFDVITFEKLNLIDKKLLLITVFFLILLIYVSIKYSRIKKEYKKEKIKFLQEQNKKD